jgi:hypothetical protein
LIVLRRMSKIATNDSGGKSVSRTIIKPRASKIIDRSIVTLVDMLGVFISNNKAEFFQIFIQYR